MIDLIKEQMEFLEESTKKTFRIPVKEEFDETAAENLAEDTARDEEYRKEFNELPRTLEEIENEDLPPEEPLTESEKELNND